MNQEDSVSATAPAGSGATVAVSFFTMHPFPLQQMPTTTFSVPSTTLPEGLNALVNDVLEIKPHPIPFDFLINGEYVTVSLATFIRRRALTSEDVLHIEYLPALQAQEGSRLPHDDWVSTLRAPVCGNADFVVTGAYDHCVRVWNADTCLAVGTGHVEAVKSVAVLPGSVEAIAPDVSKSAKKRGRPAGGATADGAEPTIGSFEFASTSKDGSVRLWHFNAATSALKSIAVPAGLHADGVDTCDFNSAGTLLATGGWDAAVVVTSVADLKSATALAPAKPNLVLTDHARPVLSVRFSPAPLGAQSNTLYSTGLDGAVKVWDVSQGKLMSTLKGDHSAYGMSVRPPTDAASSSSDLIACGHSDNRIRIYDPRTKTVARTMTGHRQWVYSVAWLWRPEEATENASGPMTLLASASEDGSVRVWDLRSTSSALLTLDALHNDGVLDVTYAGAMKIASGGKDNKTRNATVEQPK